MKAIHGELQEGLDAFLKNEFWRSIYEAAPKGAKEKLETEFFCSHFLTDESRKEIAHRIWEHDIKPSMKAEDWRYLAKFSRHPQQKAFYLKQAEEAEAKKEK